MSAISLRIPESLHRHLRELAEREGVSINQFIATAVAEKVAALQAEEYLQARAGRASRARFDAALAQVKDAPPIPGDEVLPATRLRLAEPEAAYGPRPARKRKREKR